MMYTISCVFLLSLLHCLHIADVHHGGHPQYDDDVAMTENTFLIKVWISRNAQSLILSYKRTLFVTYFHYIIFDVSAY